MTRVTGSGMRAGAAPKEPPLFFHSRIDQSTPVSSLCLGSTALGPLFEFAGSTE